MRGRVVRGTRAGDLAPVPGAWAVLHLVRRGGGAPADSVRTDARGRYRFRLPGADTSGVYVVSTMFDSLAYFSLPLNAVGRPAVDVEDLVVYPTTRGAPPIQLTRRLLTIARPANDGTRDVLEILELTNTGFTTRVTDDTLVPTWAGAIPSAAIQFQAGQGDVSVEALRLHGDSVYVLGPIPPGPAKQLSYAYVLPARTATLTVPIDQRTEELNLLVEDTTAVVAAPGLSSLGVQEIEQRRFAAYRTGRLDARAAVTIALPGRGVGPETLLPYVIGVLAAAMVGALVWALKRTPVSGTR